MDTFVIYNSRLMVMDIIESSPGLKGFISTYFVNSINMFVLYVYKIK